MKWEKLGLLFAPSGEGWTRSHASLPVVESVREELYNVYFHTRDKDQVGRIGKLSFNLRKQKVEFVSSIPVLDHGELGMFDDAGVYPSCLVRLGDEKLLYYVGRTLSQTVPLQLAIGLALNEGNTRTFRRVSSAPIMGRTTAEPIGCAAPWVLIEQGKMLMWYVSFLRWEGQKHFYHIREAISKNGFDWQTANVVVPLRKKDEYAIGRPCVLKENGKYKMWYCHRGKSYRIGYAELEDNVGWIRKNDKAGIDVSPEGWDSKMICYPCVWRYEGRLYMLYNGNDYGRTGMGLAVCTEE